MKNLLILLCFVKTIYGSLIQYPQVSIAQGTLNGKYVETISKRKVSAFLGIPYAQPPVGNLRFEEPLPPTRWTGVLNATRQPPDCLQYNLIFESDQPVSGSENCLFLNLFVPGDAENHRDLPVLVNFHGGAFMSLSGSYYGPEYLLDKDDVIFITLNYRLGILGFLSTGDKVVPGNNGLKDQQAALRWVQNNIEAFGGNPRDVTVFGLSAGGASVHYHVLSPNSKGLISKAILISGVAMCPWAQAEDVKTKSEFVAEQLGCPTNNSEIMVECMKSRPGEHIAWITELFLKWNANPFSPFGPIVEHSHPTAVIDKDPVDIIKNKLFNEVPMWFSTTSDEGLYPGGSIMNHPEKLVELDHDWMRLAPDLLDYRYTIPTNEQAKVSKIIRKKYFGTRKINENRKGFVDVLSHRLFIYPTIKAAKLHAQYQQAPVYASLFAYKGQKGSVMLFMKENIYNGTAHGDDIAFILRESFLPMEDTDDERNMSKKMVHLVTSFMKGEPFPSKWSTQQNSLPEYGYLNISAIDESTDEFLRGGEFAREKFWSSIHFNEKYG